MSEDLTWDKEAGNIENDVTASERFLVLFRLRVDSFESHAVDS